MQLTYYCQRIFKKVRKTKKAKHTLSSPFLSLFLANKNKAGQTKKVNKNFKLSPTIDKNNKPTKKKIGEKKRKKATKRQKQR